ncbi:MAG: response regulator transcription factor [Caldilineaceae bacterium]|nr:response regulator transcription factor [Caldilineaceae bacterium]
MTRILVIDDDRLMRRSVSLSLTDAGYATETASSGEEGLASARKLRPDLVLLDIGLPGMDGLETLRAFQREIAAPVIFVTARRRELDEIVGLEMGADDYITKPFDMDILLARVKAVLRRDQQNRPVSTPSQPIAVGDLRIEPAAHQVTVRGQVVELAPKEYDLLYYLAQRAGEAVPMDEIVDNVWGDEWVGETQTVYVHVRWLRTKIEADPAKPRRLLTVRGVGYRLVPIDG